MSDDASSQLDVLGALGGRIKRLRLSAGLTQAELAGAAGISRATVIRVEAGSHELGASHLPGLAAALGVEVGDLFRRTWG